MEKKIKVASYIRRGRVDAVIYVRGKNEEMQELTCKLYAMDKKYDVLYVARNLEDVGKCDVLLVSNASRISRNYEKYCQIVKEFNNRGITIESAVSVPDSDENILKIMEFAEILKFS